MAEPQTQPLGSTQAGTRPGSQFDDINKQGGTGRFAERVRERAEAQLSTQKNRATDGLGSIAEAVRGSTQQLRDQQHDVVARYVEQAADQIETFSRRLREKDVRELLDDAQRFARRQPAMVVGTAFAIGLFAARFLKSSSPEHEWESMRRRSYDRDRPQPSETTALSSQSSPGRSTAPGLRASAADMPRAGTTSTPEGPARGRRTPGQTERS